MFVRDLKDNKLIEAEIVLATYKDMPLMKNGWKFNWRRTFSKKNGSIYVLRLKSNHDLIQGVLYLKQASEMLVMDSIEIAPHNVGKENKRYDYVAGCLIAYACRETFKQSNNYKGFLPFESKTDLIDWYIENYGAKIAMNNKMYFDPTIGRDLIEKYLDRKN